MTRVCFYLTLLVLVGCQSQRASLAISYHFRHDAVVDLASIVPGDWDRVCFLGPYSTDEDAELLLGHSWSLKSNSSVGESDGISLLLFVRGDDVILAIDHPRNKGDFSQLDDQCFARSQARFKRVPDGGNGLLAAP